MPYNFVADSFHTKKLCSRLSSRELRFQMKNGGFAFFIPLWGSYGGWKMQDLEKRPNQDFIRRRIAYDECANAPRLGLLQFRMDIPRFCAACEDSHQNVHGQQLPAVCRSRLTWFSDCTSKIFTVLASLAFIVQLCYCMYVHQCYYSVFCIVVDTNAFLTVCQCDITSCLILAVYVSVDESVFPDTDCSILVQVQILYIKVFGINIIQSINQSIY